MITVRVPLGDRSYDVIVGRGALKELAAVIPPGARRAAVVTQRAIDLDVDVDPGVPHEVFFLDEGESAKTLASVEALCRAWARWGLTRRDVVVAVGGGVVTDTAGFAASVYHRGTAVVHVATTLLAMVDAAIGGKTGVNLEEGKNLVGSFWQPAGVVCDTAVLSTLPPRELRSGCGEMAKYHFLGALGSVSGRSPASRVDGADDDEALDRRVADCVEIKAAVVAADERESGGRALLNYGHTLAHALETAGRYDLRHGEAVAIGLVFAARLARRLGRIDDRRVQEHYDVVNAYDLPTSLPPTTNAEEVVTIMGRDKKAVSALTFVLDGPGGVEVVEGVDRDAVLATLAELRAADGDRA